MVVEELVMMKDTLPSGTTEVEVWMNILVSEVSPRVTRTGVEPFGTTQKSACIPAA